MDQQVDLFSGELIPQKGTSKRNGATRRNGPRCSENLTEVLNRIESLESQVNELESVLHELRDLLVTQRTVKDWYSTIEVAEILGKKPYTVREWCRLQRVNANKALCGRGCEEEWRISHEELTRISNEGLLPVPEHY